MMRGFALIAIGKSLAVAITLLGIVHSIATFTPLVRDGLECLGQSELNAITYMSLMCGAALFLCGLGLLLLLGKFETYPILSSPILFLGGFACFNGLLGVSYMPNNPFAWINLVLGLMLFCITILLRRQVYN